MKRPEIINRIREVMRNIAPDAQTILYGSEVRGEAREDSDIDLLVLLSESRLTPERELEIVSQLYKIELETGVIISPMIMSRKTWEDRPFHTPFSLEGRSNIMKEKLTSENREAIVSYRMERAYETLKEADYNTGSFRERDKRTDKIVIEI